MNIRFLAGVGLILVTGFSAPAFAESTPEANQAFNAGVEAYSSGKADEAIADWTRAAKGGNIGAAWVMGNLYYQGRGVPQSDRKAYEYYYQAALGGHPGAQTMVGLYLEQGNTDAGVKKNYEQSRQWLEKAAMQRFPAAQYQLGRIYRDGVGLDPEPSEGLRWYILAANKRYVPAYLALAKIHFEGAKDIPKNYAEGWMYLELAQRFQTEGDQDAVAVATAKYGKWASDQQKQDGAAKVNGWLAKHPNPNAE